MIAYALPDSLVWGGKTASADLSFDVVLRLFELETDDRFDDISRTELSLEMLVRNYPVFSDLPLTDKVELLNTIKRDFILQGKKGGDGDGKKVFDWQQDAPYIFSSFMLEYGIDLVEERGRLDWRKFISLFSGLSDRAKIKEIIAIRARKIPARNEHNGEEIDALMEAKAYYALTLTGEEKREQFQQGLNDLAGILLNRAEGQHGQE